MKENPERDLTWFSFETIAAACCCNKGVGITGDTLPEFAESRFIKRDTGVTPSTETTQGHLMRQLQAVQAQQKLRTLQADPIFSSSYNNCQKRVPSLVTARRRNGEGLVTAWRRDYGEGCPSGDREVARLRVQEENVRECSVFFEMV
ncbi:hypothetical protein TIFTF001_054157 [Ficus carica]|uniref:Uncharacterized protein n=1 Tax=Ficus carica TaxID=3494 RepID=A0AA88EL21_FICCA|nr:hypothetical protein TIFTF001_054157 [Ficus carica]